MPSVFDVSKYETERLYRHLENHPNFDEKAICRVISQSYTTPNPTVAIQNLIDTLMTAYQSHDVTLTITRLRKIKKDVASLEQTNLHEACAAVVRAFCDDYGTPTYDDFMSTYQRLTNIS